MCTLSENDGKVLLYITQVRNALPQPDIKTVITMHHNCCYFIINSVAFAKEIMNETSEAIKNTILTAPVIASHAIDKKQLIIRIMNH